MKIVRGMLVSGVSILALLPSYLVAEPRPSPIELSNGISILPFAPFPLFDVGSSIRGSGGGGAAVGSDNTWTGQQTFRDNKFTITDDSDTTKAFVFQVSAVSAGATRTITVPDSNTSLPISSQVITLAGATAPRTVTLFDSDFSVAGQGTTNVFSGANTFGSAAGAANAVELGVVAGGIQFEGSGSDTSEHVLTVANPGLDVTTTIPSTAAAQTVAMLELAQTFSGVNLWTARQDFGSAADAVNAVAINETAGQITWEGAAADAAEHRLAVTVNAGFDTLTTVPATGASQTVAVLENAQTVSGAKTFSAAPILSGVPGMTVNSGSSIFFASQAGFIWSTAQTPDNMLMFTGTTGSAFHVVEQGDISFDFNNCSAGTSTATDPLLCVHSRNQNTSQYIDLSHNATNGVINVGTGGLDVPSHLGAHGTAPTVSSCGTSPSTVTGNDGFGRLTTGSGGTVQSCTITFATAYVTAPSCIANDESSILLVRATATTTTLVIDSAVAGSLASQVINYICRGL